MMNARVSCSSAIWPLRWRVSCIIWIYDANAVERGPAENAWWRRWKVITITLSQWEQARQLSDCSETVAGDTISLCAEPWHPRSVSINSRGRNLQLPALHHSHCRHHCLKVCISLLLRLDWKQFRQELFCGVTEEQREEKFRLKLIYDVIVRSKTAAEFRARTFIELLGWTGQAFRKRGEKTSSRSQEQVQLHLRNPST